jgi:hypothetical protein
MWQILNQTSIGIYTNVGKLLETTPNLLQASRQFWGVNNHDPQQKSNTQF